MIETKLIPTNTILTVLGNGIEIKTYYDENELPDTVLARIPSDTGIQDGVPYIEGEGLIQVKEYLTHIDYQINAAGELVLLVSTGDEDKYSIDADGNLIYTTEE